MCVGASRSCVRQFSLAANGSGIVGPQCCFHPPVVGIASCQLALFTLRPPDHSRHSFPKPRQTPTRTLGQNIPRPHFHLVKLLTHPAYYYFRELLLANSTQKIHSIPLLNLFPALHHAGSTRQKEKVESVDRIGRRA